MAFQNISLSALILRQISDSYRATRQARRIPAPYPSNHENAPSWPGSPERQDRPCVPKPNPVPPGWPRQLPLRNNGRPYRARGALVAIMRFAAGNKKPDFLLEAGTLNGLLSQSSVVASATPDGCHWPTNPFRNWQRALGDRKLQKLSTITSTERYDVV
jgi:hypothetical protein